MDNFFITILLLYKLFMIKITTPGRLSPRGHIVMCFVCYYCSGIGCIIDALADQLRATL